MAANPAITRLERLVGINLISFSSFTPFQPIRAQYRTYWYYSTVKFIFRGPHSTVPGTHCVPLILYPGIVFCGLHVLRDFRSTHTASTNSLNNESGHPQGVLGTLSRPFRRTNSYNSYCAPDEHEYTTITLYCVWYFCVPGYTQNGTFVYWYDE